MNKTLKFLLAALLLTLALTASALAEGEKYSVDGQPLTLIDRDDVKIYLTGGLGNSSNTVDISAVVENNTDGEIKILYKGTINGWDIGNPTYMMNIGTGLSAHSKGKTAIIVWPERVEASTYEEVQEMNLTFEVLDADNNTLFSESTGRVIFHATAEQAAAGAEEPAAEEAPVVGAPVVAEETPDEPVGLSTLVTVKGVFTGSFSEDYDEDSAKPGMVDCLVVFDYANDAENRRLPENASEITLDINGVNTYEIYKVSSNWCEYIKSIARYAGYAEPLGYGNLLGGAEPVRMLALFYVNPNDFSGSENLTLTVGDQVTTFPAADVQAVEVPADILAVEDDPVAAHRIADLRWRMDGTMLNDYFYSRVRAAPGDDLKSLATAHINLFNESIPYGIDIATGASSGFADNPYGIKFGGQKNSLTERAPSFDLEAVKSLLPEQAGLIQYLVNNTRALATAEMTRGSDLDMIGELMFNVGVAYLDLCDAIGMPDLQVYYESHRISAGSNDFIKELRGYHAHISAEDIANAEAEADAALANDKEIVKAVQQALNDAGFDCGTPDGAAGKKTAAAISAYQEANGLEVTGTINRALLKALGIL